MKDYYKILGVEDEASEEEIRARWIELTKEYHRDLKEGKELDEKIKEINQAYQVLKDPSARIEYDLERDFKRAILKRTRPSPKRIFNIKKVVLPISVLILLIILGSLIFKRGEVSIQPKEMKKGIIQEAAKIVSKPTPSPPAERELKPYEKPSTPTVSKPETSIKVEKRVPEEKGKSVVKESPKRVAKRMERIEETKPTAMEPTLPAKRETLAKVEAPKEMSKEIVPERPEMVSKEAKKVVVQESPKMATKEPERIEEKKPTAMEAALPAKRETPAKVEAPKEISKEIVPERPEMVPKETKKVVTQESPKMATKEPERIEETKPTAMEPSAKKNEVLTKSEQGVPKEVSKVVPQEVRKVEEPKPMVKEPSPIAKPATPVPSIASIPFAKEEEVRHFFTNYIDRYNRKDIEGFLSLFSSKAIQNQKDGIEEIRKIYTQFFNQSQELQYRMEETKIEIYQNAVEVKARYELHQLPKKGREKKIYRGHIRWVLVKENETLKVRFIDYRRESSS
jgi:curved DNA-binding protein CbpA